MRHVTRRPPVDRRHLMATLAGAVAIAAYSGSWYGIFGAPGIPTSWLAGSGFDSYLIPSCILGFVVGNACFVAWVCALRYPAHARSSTLAAAAILAGWILAQVAIIGYRSWLQPTLLLVAIAMATVAASSHYRRD